MFRAISQTRIAYRGSPLSEGDWGPLKAGDRLPWLASVDNHAVLDFRWQVHVAGEAGADLRAWGAERGVAVYAWPWGAEAEAAGFRRDAPALVRPDGYLGLLCGEVGAVGALDAYAARWGLFRATAESRSWKGSALSASSA